MAKKNPVTVDSTEGNDLKGHADIGGILKEAQGRIETDWRDSETWRNKLAYFAARRFGLLGRNPQHPWPGSSNVIMPVEDRAITQMAPHYDSLTFGRDDVVAMKALKAEEADYAANFQDYLNSVLLGHSHVFSTPDFREQHKLMVFNLLQHGRGVMRTAHCYKTRSEWATIHRDRLPGLLRQIAVVPNLSDEERLATQARWQESGVGGQFNPPGLTQFFGEMVNPMNKSTFARHAARIKELVIDEFRLDQNQLVDRQACDEIMTWLRTGARQTAKPVKIHTVLRNTPTVWSVDPHHFLVPRGCPLDIQRAGRLTERRFFYSEEELRGHAADNDWYSDALEEAAEKSGGVARFTMDDELSDVMEQRTQELEVSTRERDKTIIEVHDHWTWKDVDGDGKAELINVVFEPNSGKILKVRESPYDHNEMPYTPIYFEISGPTYASSRGVPEIIADQAKYVTAAKRAADNGRRIQTSSGFFYRRGVPGLGPESFKFGPNMAVGVDNPATDVVPIAMPQTSPLWDNEAREHQAWIDSHVGVIHQGTNSNDRLERPITKGEIGVLQGNRQQVLSDRGNLFLSGMNRVYNQLMHVARQFAPDEFYARTTRGEARELKRTDIRGDFSIRASGNVSDMDPEFRQQQAMAMYQMLLQAGPVLAQQQLYVPNLGRALKNVLDTTDREVSDQLLFRRNESELKDVMASQEQRAEEARRFQALAKQALENAPMTAEDMRELMIRMGKMMPHREIQELIVQGETESQAKADISALARREMEMKA